jgi:protein gp37
MGQQTKISWCHSTLNFWIGCTQFAAECANCYAADLDHKRFSRTLGEGTPENPVKHWGKGQPRHITRALEDGTLLNWSKRPWICSLCGEAISHTSGSTCPKCHQATTPERRRVFIGSLMDWADEEVPDSWRDALFDQADKATDLRLLFLTKRGENAHRYLSKRYGRDLPPHFWIGSSYMQDQPPAAMAWMFEFDASVRWLSVEPMLGLCQLQGQFGSRVCNYLGGVRGIHWVIFGGESGPKARPCNIDHIRAGVMQCEAAGVKAFVKQMGSNAVCDNANLYDWPEGTELIGQGMGAASCRVKFRHKAGADPAEWPDQFQVQEVPDL